MFQKLLVHPKITGASWLAVLTTLASFGPQIYETFGARGLIFEMVIGVLVTLCTTGRSIVKSVDNPNAK